MNTYMIISLILVILLFALVMFTNDNVSSKIYRAFSGAVMAIIGVVGFQMLGA